METRKNEAAEKKRSGMYNCAQAVLCTYCDLTGLDESTSKTITDAFGAGMGNMEGTCGAIVGAGITLSLINKNKPQSMQDMRLLMQKFQDRNKATQCKLLKGIETHKVLRSCPECVADAAEFLEELLNNKH